MGHSLISPSGWDRWSVCPGSVEATKDAPRTSSFYADEGTCAHLVLERTLNGHRLRDHVGQELDVASDGEEPRIIRVTDEMVDAVKVAQDYVGQRKAEMEIFGQTTLVRSETRVDPAPLIGTKHCAGTTDLILLSDDEVEAADYKHGKGYAVEIGTPDEPNGQLGLYLLGVLAAYKGKLDWRIKMAIIQPRAPHPDGPIRSISLEPEHVEAFIDRAKTAVSRALAKDAPRVPHPKACKWCAAKATCREYMEQAAELAGTPAFDNEAMMRAFAEVAVSKPSAMGDDMIAGVLANLDFIRGYLNSVEEYAHAALLRPDPPPELAERWKLVHGVSRRQWDRDDKAALQAIQRIRWTDPITGKLTGLKKNEITVQKLRSPAQLEKEIKTRINQGLASETHLEALERLIEKPQGALKLVPVSDKRPPVRPTVDQMFHDVDVDNDEVSK